MATTDRPTAETSPERLAGVVQDAKFLALIARADGPGAAAAGLLAGAADTRETPFQVSLVETVGAARDRASSVDETTTVVSIGHPLAEVDHAVAGDSVAATAYEAVMALGEESDPAVALAGVLAGGGHTADLPSAQSDLQQRGHRRQPGIATPGVAAEDALAFSTLYHGPPSGRPDRASALLDDLDSEPDDRTVASAVALTVAGDDERPESISQTIERFLHPLVTTAEWGSVEALADLLEATARMEPGLAVMLALGEADLSAVREVWRAHGQEVHTAVREASMARYDGIVEATTTASPASVARLLRDCRSPEPAAIVCGEGELALATTDVDARSILRAEIDSGQVGGHSTVAIAHTDNPEEMAEPAREHL